MWRLLYRRGEIALLAALCSTGSLLSFGQPKNVERIDATAFGTSAQLVKNFGIRITIYEFSDSEDQDILVKAFHDGQNDGLVNALGKMKSVGRITITGTVGYDLSYIREIFTPDGRTIRFVINRKIAFDESYSVPQVEGASLTAGEIKFNDQEPNKSEGVLYSAAKFIINDEGKLQIDLKENPWKLVNILEWR